MTPRLGYQLFDFFGLRWTPVNFRNLFRGKRLLVFAHLDTAVVKLTGESC
jgi:hypothetical protein